MTSRLAAPPSSRLLNWLAGALSPISPFTVSAWPAIVPESVLDALRAAEDAEDAAEADAAMDEPGESIPWEQVKAECDV